jgi:hypothetical protein
VVKYNRCVGFGIDYRQANAFQNAGVLVFCWTALANPIEVATSAGGVDFAFNSVINTGQGIVIRGGTATAGPSSSTPYGYKIFNNTLATAQPAGGIPLWVNPNNTTCDFEISNNMVISLGRTNVITMNLDGTASPAGTYTGNNNHYAQIRWDGPPTGGSFPNRVNPSIIWGTTAYATLALWKAAATPFDTNATCSPIQVTGIDGSFAAGVGAPPAFVWSPTTQLLGTGGLIPPMYKRQNGIPILDTNNVPRYTYDILGQPITPFNWPVGANV